MNTPSTSTLDRIASGAQLFGPLAASPHYRTDFDDFDNEEAAELVGAIFQDLEDIGEQIASAGDAGREDIEADLNDIIAELNENGYALYGGIGPEQERVTEGNRHAWSAVTLQVKVAGGAERLTEHHAE